MSPRAGNPNGDTVSVAPIDARAASNDVLSPRPRWENQCSLSDSENVRDVQSAAEGVATFFDVFEPVEVLLFESEEGNVELERHLQTRGVEAERLDADRGPHDESAVRE